MSAPVIDQAAPTVEVLGETDGEMRVRFPLIVIEGLDTADGRYIAPDALTARALPLTILAQTKSQHGGDQPPAAVTVGRLDTIERVPGPEVISKQTGEPFAEGTYVWRGTGAISTSKMIDGDNVADFVRRRFLRFVSADLLPQDYELFGVDGSDKHPDDPSLHAIVHRGELAGLTIVPISAFGDCYLEIDDDVSEPVTVDELPEGLAASAFPSWRAAEIGDPVAVIAAGAPNTGGMIALIPANAAELAIEGGDPVDELHLTLAYLGEDVTGWDDTQRAEILAAAEQAAAGAGPVEAEVMGHAAFNPTGANDRQPCAVYLVSGPGLPTMRAAFEDQDASDHPVFLPHVTAGYGLEPAQLSFVGPVTFDRLRVALGDEITDYALGGTSADLDDGVAMAASPLPGEDEVVDPAIEPGAGGYPESPQACQYGDEPAVRSLLFRDEDAYVPVCDQHEQEAREQLEAAGEVIVGVVDIETDTEGTTEQDDDAPAAFIARKVRTARGSKWYQLPIGALIRRKKPGAKKAKPKAAAKSKAAAPAPAAAPKTSGAGRSLTEADRAKVRDAAANFTPADISTPEQADAFYEANAVDLNEEQARLVDPAGGMLLDVNDRLQEGRPLNERERGQQKQVDALMKPLPEDVQLNRSVSGAAFGITSRDIGPSLEAMKGKVITDKTFASTSLDTPSEVEPDSYGPIEMHIAAPAGTRAAVVAPKGDADWLAGREVILARGQRLAITDVQPNSSGDGWDVHAIVIPKTSKEKAS